MSLPALHLGRACWALQDTHNLGPQIVRTELIETEAELDNLLRIVNNEPHLIFNSGESAIKWALHLSLHYKQKPLVEHQHNPSTVGDPGWVYKALEAVGVPTEANDQWDNRTVAGVSGLLQALHCYDIPPLKEHIPILLQALSISGDSDISTNAAHLLVKENIVDWFKDNELWPILQSSSVWFSLVHVPVNFNSHSFYVDFISLALANVPDWHTHIWKAFCCWITAFFRLGLWDLAEKYNSVLYTIWNQDISDYEFSNNREKALGLSFIALSNTWEAFDFGASDSLKQSVLWLHCTSSSFLALGDHLYHDQRFKVTPPFRTNFTLPLQNSLIHAAAVARQMADNGSTDSEEVQSHRHAVFYNIARILENMAGTIPKPTDTGLEVQYWFGIKGPFMNDIKQLEKSIWDMSE
ncbi:hypothetical protein C8R44DRAFT_942035 [Mycena epipterygia]|nr:hypothetical protein C8R44DRAFT_942035 [Mycena epipterygia]